MKCAVHLGDVSASRGLACDNPSHFVCDECLQHHTLSVIEAGVPLSTGRIPCAFGIGSAASRCTAHLQLGDLFERLDAGTARAVARSLFALVKAPAGHEESIDDDRTPRDTVPPCAPDAIISIGIHAGMKAIDVITHYPEYIRFVKSNGLREQFCQLVSLASSVAAFNIRERRLAAAQAVRAELAKRAVAGVYAAGAGAPAAPVALTVTATPDRRRSRVELEAGADAPALKKRRRTDA